MEKKRYKTWDDVPKEELVDAVNIVFDPPIDEAATMKDSRKKLIAALEEEGVIPTNLETLV